MAGWSHQHRSVWAKCQSPKEISETLIPYNLIEDQDDELEDCVRMAGRGGIGDGERPKWPWLEGAGDAAAFEPLKDERRDDGLSTWGGGNMLGVLQIEVDGVRGAA